MELSEIIILLRGCKLIEKTTSDNMLEVKRLRDDIAHKPDYKIDSKAAAPILEKAIKSLEELYH